MSAPTIVAALPATYQLYGRTLAGLAKRGRASVLPERRLVRPQVMLTAEPIAHYASLCGFNSAHGVPMAYPHLLAFPLHLMLMTDTLFPWPALGLVHLANSTCQHAVLRAGDALRVEVEFGALQRHAKGQAFAIETRVFRAGAAVWDSTSVYLRLGALPVTSAAPDYTPLAVIPTLAPTARWQLDAGLGRRYARVAADYNPIHLSAVSARLFGFPRAIMHGMWTQARALAALQPPQPLDAAELKVEFKTPLWLPGQATLWCEPGSGGNFEVRDASGAKPHVRGRLRIIDEGDTSP